MPFYVFVNMWKMFRGNEKWLAVLQDLDCVDMLSQILLIPDFTARYANNNNNNIRIENNNIPYSTGISGRLIIGIENSSA